MSAAHALAMGLEAAAPPAVRDEVRLMVAQHGPPARPHRASSTCPTTCARATCWSSTRRRRSRRRCPRAGPTASAVDLHLSTPDPTNPDRWVVEVRARRPPRAARRAETLDAARPAARRALIAPYLEPDRLWIAQLDLPEPLLAYLTPTAPRSATPTSRPPARSRTTRRSSPPSPAARRCRAPAARSPSAR